LWLKGKAWRVTDIRVRTARAEDAAAIAEIYNQGIRGRNATFEVEERSAENRLEWLQAHDEHHPCLVAVLTEAGQETVVGWVSADGYRARPCYRGIAEFSVYVHDDYQGHGVGSRLMEAFLPACEAAGLWKVLSRVFPENEGSLALCKKFGFREVGTYEQHGCLDGVWRDVVIVERRFPRNQEGPPPAW
jgi:phosphinothricin acetyltransferase